MAGMGHGEWHIDALANNLLVGYRPQNFIADRFFPVVNVQKESGLYAKIDRGNWFRVGDQTRAPKTRGKQVGYTVSSASYRVQNFALETMHDWETLANADAPHRPREQAGMFLMDQLSLGYEVRVRDKIYANPGSTTTLTGINAWTDYANSNPLGDIEVAQNAIFSTTGAYANRMKLGRRTYQVLRRHPQLLQAANPTGLGGGLATVETIASVFQIPGAPPLEVVIPGAIQNTAQDNQADVFSEVWSTHCILMNVAAAPGLMVPSYGYAFRWANPELGPGLSAPPNWSLETKDDEDIRATLWRTGYYQDEVIVSPELSHLISTGITA